MSEEILCEPNVNICRLCSKSDNTLLHVFGDIETNLWEKILLCSGVQINVQDLISKKICKSCYYFVNTAYEHRVSYQENNKKLEKEYEDYLLKVEQNKVIPYPEHISQNDFLNSLKLTTKDEADKIKSVNPPLHSSVLNLKRKFPTIRIPYSCYYIDIDPYVNLLPPEKLRKLRSGTWLVSKRKGGKQSDLILKRVRNENKENDKDVASDTNELEVVPTIKRNTRSFKVNNSSNETSINQPAALNNTAEDDRTVLKTLLKSDEDLTQTLSKLTNVKETSDTRDNIVNFPCSEEDRNLLMYVGQEAQTFICQTCNKVFDTQDELNHHKRSNHRTSLRCNRCPKKFNLVETLMKHLQTHNKKIAKKPSPQPQSNISLSNNNNDVTVEAVQPVEIELVNNVVQNNKSSDTTDIVNSNLTNCKMKPDALLIKEVTGEIGKTPQIVEPITEIGKTPLVVEPVKEIGKTPLVVEPVKEIGKTPQVVEPIKAIEAAEQIDLVISDDSSSSDEDCEIIENDNASSLVGVKDTVSQPQNKTNNTLQIEKKSVLEAALTPQLQTQRKQQQQQQNSKINNSKSNDDKVVLIEDSDGEDSNSKRVRTKVTKKRKNYGARNDLVTVPAPISDNVNMKNELNYIKYLMDKCNFEEAASSQLKENWKIPSLLNKIIDVVIYVKRKFKTEDLTIQISTTKSKQFPVKIVNTPTWDSKKAIDFSKKTQGPVNSKNDLNIKSILKLPPLTKKPSVLNHVQPQKNIKTLIGVSPNVTTKQKNVNLTKKISKNLNQRRITTEEQQQQPQQQSILFKPLYQPPYIVPTTSNNNNNQHNVSSTNISTITVNKNNEIQQTEHQNQPFIINGIPYQSISKTINNPANKSTTLLIQHNNFNNPHQNYININEPIYHINQIPIYLQASQQIVAPTPHLLPITTTTSPIQTSLVVPVASTNTQEVAMTRQQSVTKNTEVVKKVQQILPKTQSNAKIQPTPPEPVAPTNGQQIITSAQQVETNVQQVLTTKTQVVKSVQKTQTIQSQQQIYQNTQQFGIIAINNNVRNIQNNSQQTSSLQALNNDTNERPLLRLKNLSELIDNVQPTQSTQKEKPTPVNTYLNVYNSYVEQRH